MTELHIVATKKATDNPNAVEHTESYGIYTDDQNPKGRYLYDVHYKRGFFKDNFKAKSYKVYYSYNTRIG